MSDPRPVEVTAAEIAESLGIHGSGRRGERLVAAPPREPVPPGEGEGHVVLVWWCACLTSVSLVAGLVALGVYLFQQAVILAKLLGLAVAAGCGGLALHVGRRRRRPPTDSPGRAVRAETPPALAEVLAACATHLSIIGADGVEEPHGWSEVQAAAVARGAYLLVIAGREVHLPLTPEAEAIYRTARMLRIRRARAGEQGLAFVDEADDASLSRMTGDEADIGRGLSISEGEG